PAHGKRRLRLPELRVPRRPERRNDVQAQSPRPPQAHPLVLLQFGYGHGRPGADGEADARLRVDRSEVGDEYRPRAATPSVPRPADAEAERRPRWEWRQAIHLPTDLGPELYGPGEERTARLSPVVVD